MKKVMAFGSFSMIHPGHLHYLEQAKKYGDYLTVVITTDKNYRKEKNKKPVLSQGERKRVLESLKIVDKVVIGDEKDFMKPIAEEKPDVIAIGHDGKCSAEKMAEKTGVKTFRIKKLGNYNTTLILKR